VNDQQFVKVEHQVGSDRYTTVFVHVSEIRVDIGDRVQRGDVIALSGNTGCSTEPHLHFHVWRLTNTNNGQPARVDPYGWKPTEPDPWAEHPDGVQSVWLWLPGEAPMLDT
jgi:murein DD-endopeptidase MepM/ murein hydrolase activator NlpD